MAKDIFNDKSISRNNDDWAKNIPIYRDPVSGKQINSVGDTRPQREVNPSPVGTGTKRPGDSQV
jgi:hypothetical protein